VKAITYACWLYYDDFTVNINLWHTVFVYVSGPSRERHQQWK